MTAWWRWKTKTARRVYNRKPHAWSQSDVERVVRRFAEDAEPDVPMMSEIADRILFWLGERLGVFQAVGWAAGLLMRVFSQIQGQNPAPVSGRPHGRFLPVIDVGAALDDQVLVPEDNPYKLTRNLCQAMIDWLDKEGK